MKLLLILNDAPYGTERSYNGLRLAGAYAPEVVPGIKEGGQNMYTLEGAEAIARKLSSFSGGRIIILIAAPLYKCPAAPYEAAMLIDCHLKRSGVRNKTEIGFYTAEPGPMGTAGPDVSAGVRQMLEVQAIHYYPNHQVARVEPKSKQVRFANGFNAAFDLLFSVAPHRLPVVVKEAGLLSESSWVQQIAILLKFSSKVFTRSGMSQQFRSKWESPSQKLEFLLTTKLK